MTVKHQILWKCKTLKIKTVLLDSVFYESNFCRDQQYNSIK